MISESDYYLGIDGGQSSTTALIADASGRIVGRGNAGPCNHVSGTEARAKFANVIGTCVGKACQQAGLIPGKLTFASACFGFSGGPEDKDIQTRQLVQSSRYKITHDAEIALVGATAGEPGIIIIAGTGSMAFGRNAAGRTARAGGWGYIFGDEGGAFDLTRHALRAALKFEEGWGEPTVLHRLLLEATGARDANALMHSFYAGASNTAIAALAPVVTRAAELGDEPAWQILKSAGAKLTWFVEGVYKQLFPDGKPTVVAYVGGVFKSELFRKAFAQCIRNTIGCVPEAPRMSPAAGAVLEALRLAGNQVELSGLPEPEN